MFASVYNARTRTHTHMHAHAHSKYLIPKALEESGIRGENQHDGYVQAVLKQYGVEDRIDVEIPGTHFMDMHGNMYVSLCA